MILHFESFTVHLCPVGGGNAPKEDAGTRKFAAHLFPGGFRLGEIWLIRVLTVTATQFVPFRLYRVKWNGSSRYVLVIRLI